MAKTVVVTPYFEDIACKDFCFALAKEFNEEMQLIIIDDGSVKRILTSDNFINIPLDGVILRLKRNLGHQTAIAIGINFAVKNYDFDSLVILDSDGEDLPSDIPKLLESLKRSGSNVVVAKRKSRHESIKFKLFYLIYQLFFRLMVGQSISFGNFMAMDKIAAKRLAASNETALHIAATVLNSKLSLNELPLDRGIRYAGKSKMNMVNLVLHGLRSIMVFSEEVIVRITLLCLVVAVLVFGGLVAIMIMKFIGATIPGWYSTGSGLLMLLLFQIGSMAVLMLLTANRASSFDTDKLNYKMIISDVISIK